MAKKLTQEEFIAKANAKHNFKYTYFNFKYIDAKTKGWITCHEHGDFLQKPNCHTFGQGCYKCGREEFSKKIVFTQEEFEEKANIKHNNRYTYLNFVYINSKTKGWVTCKEHGDFLQRPDCHLEGKGCRKCSLVKYSKIFAHTLESVIKKLNKIYNYKYDYSMITSYTNNRDYVTIICKKHREFTKQIGSHISGQGCPTCSFEKKYFKRNGMTQVDYQKQLPEFKRYHNAVIKITYKQPINILKNFDKKRGKSGTVGVYQLDHKFSIIEGFKQNISPEIIGNIVNLEFLTWEENLRKQGNCSITIKELATLINFNTIR